MVVRISDVIVEDETNLSQVLAIVMQLQSKGLWTDLNALLGELTCVAGRVDTAKLLAIMTQTRHDGHLLSLRDTFIDQVEAVMTCRLGAARTGKLLEARRPTRQTSKPL